jgi:hypothetical protein
MERTDFRNLLKCADRHLLDFRKHSFPQLIYFLDISVQFSIILPTEFVNHKSREKKKTPMNKDDLVSEVAQVVSTKKEAEAVFDKPPRKGRNPKGFPGNPSGQGDQSLLLQGNIPCYPRQGMIKI